MSAYTTGQLESIAKSLGVAGRSGSGWTCRCPAHEDRRASLSLNIGESGRLLWHCHAGCDQNTVRDALRTRGLLMNGDARPAEPKRGAGKRGRIVAAYPYVDEQGAILFEVVRYEPKDFRQRRPDGKGGWTWKLGDTRRVLYRLPEVLAADEVILVEGERDVENLRAVGFTATTSPQGAKFWRDELAAPLASKRVAIIPDNDEAGRKHAQIVAAAARQHGAASVKVVPLEGLPEKGDISDWLDTGHTADELRELVAKAPKWEPTTEAKEAIYLEPGELQSVVEKATRALGRATRKAPLGGFYRMGGMLVRVSRLADAAELNRSGVRRARGALVIVPAEPEALRLALAGAARWGKLDAQHGALTPSDVPITVAKAIIATAADWSEIPILTGIVEVPTLRPDGTVLDRPGYDPDTGLLFDPGGTEFPSIPESPSRDQALQALARITDLLSGFPFADEASKSVAVSGIITPLVRKACRAVPLHAISAPKMASGKTLLATFAGYIATGRTPALMSQADDPSEERKRLLAVLIEGQNVVVIDNVERELKSDALCTILTEPVFSDRLLGANKTVRASSAATFFATGNNLAVAGDLTARAISCALDPRCERPEEREFKVDLHKVVPERRAELAVAALTIVRAYLAAGEPDVGIPNFARFEDWSRFVRRSLVWLGMEDPCKGRERIEGRDPVRAQLGALLQAWYENYPGEAATVAEAIKTAKREPIYINGVKEPDAVIASRERLFNVMREIASKGNDIDGRMLGNFIAKHEGRFESNFRFERRDVSHGAVRWRVFGSGELGELGEFSSSQRGGLSEQVSAVTEGPAANSPNSPNSLPWTDAEGWLALLQQADGWSEKTAALSAWAKAAGYEVKRAGEGKLALLVPRNLRRDPARTELLKQADGLGLTLVEYGTKF